MRSIAIAAPILATIILTAVSSAAVSQAPLPGPQRAAITDSIRNVADSVFAAGQRRDLTRMFSFYAPTTTLLHDGNAENWPEHQAVAHSFYRTLRAVDVHPLSYEIAVLSPTTALWRGQYAYSFTDSGGHVTSGKAANTWVFVRRPTGWQIVHVHISDPLPDAK